MSPNDVSLSVFGFSSSDTSDSDSFLEQDINNCESQLNKQWEAIERTLYQEDGQQISDPELLKECKLWRDTFPHIRVKGTKIDNPNPKKDDEDEDSNKSIQTSNNFDLKKLGEKQELIKSKVVDALVERLMNKFNLNNVSEKTSENGVQVTELGDEENVEVEPEKPESRASDSEEESYYERGKHPEENLDDEPLESSFDVSGEWSVKDATPNETTDKLLRPSLVSNYPDALTRKSEKHIPSSNSLVKPFEPTKKIDRKYEGLLDKIVERRFSELEPVCSLQEIRGYRESLEKLRVNSGFDKSFRKSRNFPRLNKFSNNWLDRGEIHAQHNRMEKPSTKQTKTDIYRTAEGDHGDNATQEQLDEQFIEDVRNEMMKRFKRPAKNRGLVNEISLRRPQPYPYTAREMSETTQKSYSCGDLLKRNTRKVQSVQKEVKPVSQLRTKAIKPTNTSKNKKLNASTEKNLLLPPIETGIICTELKITPKGSSRPSHKKY